MIDAGPEGAVKYVCCVCSKHPNSDMLLVSQWASDKYRGVAQRINQRLERIRHGSRRVWVDDEDLSECGNHLVVCSMVPNLKVRSTRTCEKFLQKCLLSTLHALVFALLDINDQRLQEQASAEVGRLRYDHFRAFQPFFGYWMQLIRELLRDRDICFSK